MVYHFVIKAITSINQNVQVVSGMIHQNIGISLHGKALVSLAWEWSGGPSEQFHGMNILGYDPYPPNKSYLITILLL